MKRLLFVDDEPQVLEGLRNLLRPQRKRWDMHFAQGGEQALAELAQAPFDVVISDMRMPGMDGQALLKRVAELYPRVVRIVLSGQTELEVALKSVSIAHQFLSKPCEADVLQNVLDRACALSALLHNEALRQVVAGIKRLPTTPQLFLKLTHTLADPTASLKTVAELLSKDVAVCARVLQLVNSPFFGLNRRVTSVLEAATFLGSTTIKSVVLSVESFAVMAEAPNIPGFSFEALHRHSLYTANLAKHVIGDANRREHAFMGGMLHDIGMLILATHFPQELKRLVHEPGWVEREDAESDLSHARLGAYLLGLWGLPYPVIEAVAHHHGPHRIEHRTFDVPDAVYVADRLAAELYADGNHGAEHPGELDMDYLGRLGIDAPKVAGWRAIALELAQGKAAA